MDDVVREILLMGGPPAAIMLAFAVAYTLIRRADKDAGGRKGR